MIGSGTPNNALPGLDGWVRHGAAGQEHGSRPGVASPGLARHVLAGLGKSEAWIVARRGAARLGKSMARVPGETGTPLCMTDQERIDFLERSGANVVAISNDTLLPDSFNVCVNRVTGWHSHSNLRAAIDACERDVRTNLPNMISPNHERAKNV